MQITSKKLKELIREELETMLSEGALGDAKTEIPRNSGNDFLDAFHTLENLSGPGASLVNWIQNAEGHARKGNRDAAKAVEVVKGIMAKQSAMSEGLPEKKEIEENSRQLNPLERQLMKQEPELFQWYLDQNVDPQFLEIDNGRWYIIYNAIDQGYRSRLLPDGWSSDTYAQGGSDEDTNYIITKDSDSDPRSMFDWWEDENL